MTLTTVKFQDGFLHLDGLVGLTLLLVGEYHVKMIHTLKRCGGKSDTAFEARMMVVGFVANHMSGETHTAVVTPPNNL